MIKDFLKITVSSIIGSAAIQEIGNFGKKLDSEIISGTQTLLVAGLFGIAAKPAMKFFKNK